MSQKNNKGIQLNEQNQPQQQINNNSQLFQSQQYEHPHKYTVNKNTIKINIPTKNQFQQNTNLKINLNQIQYNNGLIHDLNSNSNGNIPLNDSLSISHSNFNIVEQQNQNQINVNNGNNINNNIQPQPQNNINNNRNIITNILNSFNQFKRQFTTMLRQDKKKLVKFIFIFISMTCIFLTAHFFMIQTFVQSKSPSLYSSSYSSLIKPTFPFYFFSLLFSQNIKQIASPDQIENRAFFYYQKMSKLAKENVINKYKYNMGQNKQLDKQLKLIQFQQLFSIFKVLKAVQLANGYKLEPDDKNNHQENSGENQNNQQNNNQIDYQQLANLSSPFNLTQYFNPIKDQGFCASCYSFPISATIQFQYRKRLGINVSLSEQQLIDCASGQLDEIKKARQNKKPQKINGCQGGNLTRGFQFIKKYGLVQDKFYPYRSQVGISYQCNLNVTGLEQAYFGTKNNLTNKANKKKEANNTANSTSNNGTNQTQYNPKTFNIKGFRQLPEGNCKSIQFQLSKKNAVAAIINVGNIQDIKNFSQPFRDCLRTSPNHAITIVGQTQNQDWIIRNSWGQSWGNKGYFIIKKGNTCGICNHPFVPFLQGDQVQMMMNDQLN